MRFMILIKADDNTEAGLMPSEANRLFTDLGAGGQVQMPLARTFFSPCFGMVADRFAVSWMILVEA